MVAVPLAAESPEYRPCSAGVDVCDTVILHTSRPLRVWRPDDDVVESISIEVAGVRDGMAHRLKVRISPVELPSHLPLPADKLRVRRG